MQYLRIKLTTLTSISIIISLFVSSLIAIVPQRAAALSGSDFNPSLIMGDSVFFAPGSISDSEIQAFLNAKLPICDTNGTQAYGGTTRAAYGASRGYPAPYTCLKDYSQNIPGIAADAYCGGVASGTFSAAQIIGAVGRACGVSPKVLLVLLQKEQSLITDDWPWSIQYTKATGMGCPDSSLGVDVDANQNGCYDDYEGFFKQIYYGARQFKRYVQQPQSFNYAVGRNSFIAYQANNAGCGGTYLTPQSAATAALYNYTPYQPNAAALANLYGTGDGCSAYGNRNFWRMFNDWFGSSTETFSIRDTDISWNFEKLIGNNKGIAASANSQGGTPKAINYNGGLYVFHHNYSKGTLDAVIEDGSGWRTISIDGSGGTSSGTTTDRVGLYASAAVYNGILYIAHYDETAKDIRLTSFNGSVWTSTTLDGNRNEPSTGANNASVGERPSLVVYGSSLQLFYYDASNGNLRHAWTSASQGWKFENLDGDNLSIARSTADSGIDVVTGFNPSNGKLMLFYKQDGALKYAWTSTTGWHFAYLDGVNFSLNGEFSSSIADPDFLFIGGNLQLFYQDSGVLKHAWGAY